MPTLIEHINAVKGLLLQKYTTVLKKEFYLSLTGETTFGKQKSVSLELLVKKFLNDKAKVLLLQGHAGTGKTTFCHHLAAQLLESKEYEDVIPLYISLKPEYSKNRNVIESILQEHGFSSEQIIRLKQTQKFLFIFDNYELLGNFQNIHMFYQLEQWQAKVIVICCPEYFTNTTDYHSYFIPYQNKKPQQNLLQEVNIGLLTDEQINIYLKHFLLQDIFQTYSEPLPLLKSLARNPLFLKIIVNVISNPPIQEIKDKRQMDRAWLHSNLLNIILDGWFSHYEEKLKNSGLWDKNDDTLKQQLWDFGIALARGMQKQKVTRVIYKPVSKLFPENQGVWSKFFDDVNPKINLLRTACPLIKVDIYQYEFVHPDILNYLADRAILKTFDNNIYQDQKIQETTSLQVAHKPPLISNDLLNHYLNQKLFTRDNSLIRFFADRVWESDAFRNELFELVIASKKVEQIAMGAANAITILNAAKMPFSGMDLSYVQIQGADLSRGIFHQVDFQHANLENVLFHQGCLHEMNAKQANMRNVIFGEHSFLTQPSPVYSLAFNSHYNHLAVGCRDKKIYIYEWPVGRLIKVLSGHEGDISCLVWQDDQLVSGGSDNTVRLWDVVSGESKVFRGHTKQVTGLAWQNKQLVSGSGDRTIRLWNTANEKETNIICKHEGAVLCLSCYADQLAFGSSDNTVRVWDVTNNKESHVLRGHEDAVSCLVWQNGQLLSGSLDKTIRLWNLTYQNEQQILRGHEQDVTCLALNEDRLASGDLNETIRVWDIVSGQTILVLRGHENTIMCLGWDNKQLISSGMDSTIRLWDIPEKQLQQRELYGHENWITCIAWNNDRQLASGSHDKTIRLWDIANGREKNVLRGHENRIRCVAWQKQLLASGDDDSNIYLWDVANGQIRQKLTYSKNDGWVTCLAWRGKWLAAGYSKGMIRVWDTEIMKQKELQGHTDWVAALAWQGELLASGSRDKTINIWNIEEGKEKRILYGHTNEVTRLIWQGEQLISGSTDETIRLWNITNGKTLQILRGHIGTVVELAWRERYLLSWDKKGLAIVWDFASKTPKLATRYLQSFYTIFYCGEGNIATVSANNGIGYWKGLQSSRSQILTPPQLLDWKLQWVTRPVLDMTRMKIEGTKITKEQDRCLLEQRGAIGTVKLIDEHKKDSQFSSDQKGSSSAPLSIFFTEAGKNKSEEESSTQDKAAESVVTTTLEISSAPIATL